MDIWKNREKWESENFQNLIVEKPSKTHRKAKIVLINPKELVRYRTKHKPFNLYKTPSLPKMKVSSIHIDEKVLHSLQASYEKFNSKNDYPQIKKISEIVIDNDRGSVRKMIPTLMKEMKERALSGGLSEEEKQQRSFMRQKKYCSYEEVNNIGFIIVTDTGYAMDFKTGKMWKSKLLPGYHTRQSKLIGK